MLFQMLVYFKGSFIVINASMSTCTSSLQAFKHPRSFYLTLCKLYILCFGNFHDLCCLNFWKLTQNVRTFKLITYMFDRVLESKTAHASIILNFTTEIKWTYIYWLEKGYVIVIQIKTKIKWRLCLVYILKKHSICSNQLQMTNRAFSDLLAFRIVDKQHSMLLKRKTEHETESTTERKRDIYIFN